MGCNNFHVGKTKLVANELKEIYLYLRFGLTKFYLAQI